MPSTLKPTRWKSSTLSRRHPSTAKKVLVQADRAKTKSSLRTLPLVPPIRDRLLMLKGQQETYRRLCGKATTGIIWATCVWTRSGTSSAPTTLFRQKRMDRRIKFICPFDLAEHQGVEPWHRSPGLSHFESLNRLDEAGFTRLSLAVAGIFCASQKLHISAIYRRKSTTFCEVPLENSPFTQSVRSCISGAVPLDVR